MSTNYYTESLALKVLKVFIPKVLCTKLYKLSQCIKGIYQKKKGITNVIPVKDWKFLQLLLIIVLKV